MAKAPKNRTKKKRSLKSARRQQGWSSPSQLKQFLENKDLNFKEKLVSLQKETSETKREALPQVLIKWLRRVDELATAARDTRDQITEETELAGYDEAWADLSAMITKAWKKVKEFVEPPSSEEEDDAEESVTSWVEKSVADDEDNGRQWYGWRGSFRGSQKKRRSLWRRRHRSLSNHSRRDHADKKGPRTIFQGFTKTRGPSNRCRQEPSPFEWQNDESPRRSSGSAQLAKKTLAEDALKSIPIFKGGHSEYVGWRMTGTKFLKIGFYSQETAFQLLKKTLEGNAKKVVELISVEDEHACEDLMQSLEDEYGDVSFLAVKQKRKLTEMKTINYGARNILDFCRTVTKIARILWEAGKDVDTCEFVSLVVSHLPVAYRSSLTDALRLKKYKGLEGTLEGLR